MAETVFNESTRHVQEGVSLNPLYAPKIVPHLIKMMKFLPLWSGIMVPFFGYGERVSSSAAVESSFHKLKNITLKHVSLPTDIECFLENSIRSLRGALLLHSTQESETNVVKQIVKPIDDSVQRINIVRELEIEDN